MKKDYLPIVKKQREIEFVEDYWTTRWDAARLPALVSQIAKREELKAMLPFLDKFPKNSRILDGGCGLGMDVLYLNSLGFKATGLDISRKTIKRLKHKFPKQDFLAGDIRNTKFKPGSFDAYFSWGTFEHFEEGLTKCFTEAYRILKPRGLLFISVPFHNLRIILKPGLEPRKTMRFYQWRLTREELKQELVMNGFKPLEIKPIHKAHGLRQLLTHDLGIGPKSFLHRPLLYLMYPLVPKSFTAHMLMAVARKV